MPARVGPALKVVLGAGLLAESAVWLTAAQPGPAGAAYVLVAASVAGCVALGAVLLRRAFAPLSPHAERLHALARMRESEAVPALVSPVPPPDAAADPLRSEIQTLKRRLRAQLHESERLRAEAERATAYKTGFLRSVRHELRTPLNAVLGFSEVLLSELEGPLSASQRENLVVIKRTAQRLASLFDEVIELATVAAGQFELSRAAVDGVALLEEVCEALEEERGDRPVHIRVDAAPGTGPCAGDPYRLKQLMQGMASHALSVCTGELLSLSVGSGELGTRFVVRDGSRKLSPAEVDALRAQRTVASRRKGLDESSRLRIAIWQQLAQAYGGRFSLTSDDRGTSYALDMPSWSPP
jgi:signal transduction histidine kinase